MHYSGSIFRKSGKAVTPYCDIIMQTWAAPFQMNEIALASNEGYLLLYSFDFPTLKPIVRAKVSDKPLYLPFYNSTKQLMVSDRSVIKIFEDEHQIFELPVENARNVTQLSNNEILISTTDSSLLYDQQYARTAVIQSNLSIEYKKAAILADQKHLHFYEPGGEVTAKFNYHKHLNEYLIGFSIAEGVVVLCGQHELKAVDIEKDAPVYAINLQDIKISCFLQLSQRFLVGTESGLLVLLSAQLEIIKKYKLTDARIKAICQFGDLLVYCSSNGEFGIIYIDSDKQLSRICKEVVPCRLNGVACCGKVTIADSAEEKYETEEEE